MPMTVKVGLAKKIGQPDFGSLGASCDIELELDGGLLFNDLEGLQQKIQTAYVACRQAVNDELAGRRFMIELRLPRLALVEALGRLLDPACRGIAR